MTIGTHELDALLDGLAVAVRRDHGRQRRRRRLTVLALAAATFALATVAFAAAREDWWSGGTAVVHPAQVDEAMHENDGLIAIDLSKKATVATIPGAQLVAVATKSGGYCLSAFRNQKMVGSSCSDEPAQADGTASVYESRTSYPLDPRGDVLPKDEQFWIGYGRITDANAASLDLSSVGLPASVPLERGGFFLFELPRGSWAALDGAHGAVAIRDSKGKTLRTGCIYVGVAPGKAWSGGGGIGGAGDTCSDRRYAPPRPDLSKAQKIVERTLEHPQGILLAGARVALWQAPTADGHVCSFWALAAPQPELDTDANGLPRQEKIANPAHPTSCAKPGDWQVPGLIQVGVDSVWEHDHYTVSVQGSVKQGAGIAAVAVLAADGTSIPATFGAGEYFAELPDTPRVGKGPGPIPGGRYRVVAYDGAGNEIASKPLPVR